MIVEYNHRIEQRPIQVSVPVKIAKHIRILRKQWKQSRKGWGYDARD